MRLSDKIVDAINTQIGNEFEAAYLYLSFVSLFDGWNLDGFAAWMRAQAAEEKEHAMKFYNFLLDHDAKVDLGAIPAPGEEPKSALEAFRGALEHEQTVTQQVYDLYELSMAEKAYSAKVMLEWFIDEQVEEEKSTRSIVEKLEMIGDDTAALLVLDREFGSRAGGE